MRPITFCGQSFIAQTWNGEEKVSEIAGLSYDAAKHVARSAAITGHSGRLMGEDCDWCEVFYEDGSSREGTFAQTTLVRVPRHGSHDLTMGRDSGDSE